ncbi:hypothetical protein AAVH_29144 [Aphelenchoides avenae]|nr:hypothetical protein AAVH_29144 [Aphelenchus avenae]
MSSNDEPVCKKPKTGENLLSTPNSSSDELNTSVFTVNGSGDSLSSFRDSFDDDSKENAQVSLDKSLKAENLGGGTDNNDDEADEKISSSCDGEEFVDDEEADDEETNDDDLLADLQMWKDMRDGLIPVPACVADGRSSEEQREYILEMIRSYKGEDEQTDYEDEQTSGESDEGSSSGSGSSHSSGEEEEYDLQIDMRY